MVTLLRAALGGALLSASLSHGAVAPVEDATPSLSRPAPKASSPAVADGVPYQAPELILEAPAEPAVASPGVVFEQLQALQAEVISQAQRVLVLAQDGGRRAWRRVKPVQQRAQMRISPLSVNQLGSNADRNLELGLPQCRHASARFLRELLA